MVCRVGPAFLLDFAGGSVHPPYVLSRNDIITSHARVPKHNKNSWLTGRSGGRWLLAFNSQMTERVMTRLVLCAGNFAASCAILKWLRKREETGVQQVSASQRAKTNRR